MASSWADEGLIDAWQGALDDPARDAGPTDAQLVVATFVPAASLLLASLTLSSHSPVPVTTGWTYALDTVLHKVTATQTGMRFR